MINLRYHIVSITAVFLSLAIGLALGSTLIQRGIVDTLETRLDELGDRLDRTDGENAALREHLEERDDFEQQLNNQRLPLLAGHLADRSVLVLAAQGADDRVLAEARESLQAAGATVSGTLMFTPRWERLTAEEIEELGTLLDRRISTEEVARTLALRRLAEQLNLASQPAPEPDPPEAVANGDDLEGQQGQEGLTLPEAIDPNTEGTTEGAAAGVEVPLQVAPEVEGEVDGEGEGEDGLDDQDPLPEDEIPEPPAIPDGDFVAGLMALGYLEFQPESAAVPLPAFETSYVMIADRDATSTDGDVVIPFLQALADLAEGAVPLVVAGELGPAPELGASLEDDHDPADRLAALIGRIRTHESLTARVSTVDSLNRFEGQMALVLAVSQWADSPVGHYGAGVGAEALWPPRP